MTYASDIGSFVGQGLSSSLGSLQGFPLLGIIIFAVFGIYLGMRGAALEVFVIIMIPLAWLLYSVNLLPPWGWALFAIILGVALVYGLFKVMER